VAPPEAADGLADLVNLAELTGLPPIISHGARTLILGSFPSPASLAAGQYYGHPRNQFWSILGAVIGVRLADIDYAGRQRALIDAGVAVWDVYRRCRREGSLDAAIRDASANDFSSLQRLAPRLALVCFNGQTAGRFAPRLAALGYRTAILPSTSPAYTLAIERKLSAWRAALESQSSGRPAWGEPSS